MFLFVFKAENLQTIAALRAIQGVCEGATNYTLGSWYTKKELRKRTAILVASGPVVVIL
jgi:hypothetical protein